jgi:hypothetical protein
MKYSVVWLKAAQDLLADIWVHAPDRSAVTAASNLIDVLLARDPFADSESREGNDRVMWAKPLGVAYTVSDDDCRVTVWAVWRIA